jgi:hypothetical protein
LINGVSEEQGAMRLSRETVKVIAAWTGGVEVEEINPENGERYPALNIQCGEEVKRASLDDWVVKEGGVFDVLGPNEFLHNHFD